MPLRVPSKLHLPVTMSQNSLVDMISYEELIAVLVVYVGLLKYSSYFLVTPRKHTDFITTQEATTWTLARLVFES